jgi:CRP/FNR family transcriptional regulator
MPGSGAVFLSLLDSYSRERGPEVTCTKCNLRETCLSGGVAHEDLAHVENIVYARRQVRRGEPLFSPGDQFKCLYAIRSGFFKTTIVDGEGREQVTGFYMGGELLGLDGLDSGCSVSSAVALEDSHVCAMPYELIEKIGREVPALQRRMHSVLAREIVRVQGIMLLLGTMGARQRLAAFLVNLSRRLARRGYSGTHFLLRMTRHEIASYLGLKFETVSRGFSALQSVGLVEVRQKQIVIVDIGGLERMLAAASG